MSARELTEAQIRALKALPASITTWGGRPFAGMPKGIRSRATLGALQDRGLAKVAYAGTTEKWAITDLGRATLEKDNG